MAGTARSDYNPISGGCVPCQEKGVCQRHLSRLRPGRDHGRRTPRRTCRRLELRLAVQLATGEYKSKLPASRRFRDLSRASEQHRKGSGASATAVALRLSSEWSIRETLRRSMRVIVPTTTKIRFGYPETAGSVFG